MVYGKTHNPFLTPFYQWLHFTLLLPTNMSTIISTQLGASVPAFTPHAVSVSLPTWQDNVGYEEGDKRVLDAMVTGYPRFFIHRSIQKVCMTVNANSLALIL
jgi:hypothetical protein